VYLAVDTSGAWLAAKFTPFRPKTPYELMGIEGYFPVTALADGKL